MNGLTRQVRRQIMDQDEAYHRAMDEAGRKVKKGTGGASRSLANAARKQHHAIQAEQVATCFMRSASEISSCCTVRYFLPTKTIFVALLRCCVPPE